MRLVTFLIAIAVTTVAYADEPKQPEARTHFKAGGAAFTNADFATASQEFSAAYQIEPMPELLWSWAQSERMAGHCVTAVGLYRKYAREATKPSQTKAANDQIAQCEAETPPPTTTPPWYKDKLG